jgi:hypothetical protein
VTMNRISRLSAVAGAVLLATAVSLPAQQRAHVESTTEQTGPGPNTKTKLEWVTGTVKDYDAGKSIKIEGPGDKSYSFDLDKNAHVKGTIVVGQMAKVGYSKSADGVEHVAVLSEASPSKQAAAAAPRSETEISTKTTGPGPNAKTKSDTVVGTVKEYTAGKSIKVTGPGDKTYSFDLEGAAGVTGTPAVGDRVKVTYTKTSNGDKVTTVAPAAGK